MAGRFILTGTGKIVVAPACASLAAPTRAEINAGVVVLAPGRVNDEGITRDGLAGFMRQVQMATVADGDSAYDKQIPGLIQAQQSSFTMWASKGVTTVRDAMAEGTFLYILCFWHGDVAGRRMQVWPSQVAANNDLPTLQNEGHKYKVDWAHPLEPQLNAVVPA